MIQIEKFTFNPFQENTYVLFDESKDAVVIDPGCDTVSEENELLDFINSNGLKVKMLLNTHCHVDHILGNNFIHRKFDLKPILHQNELPVLKSTPQYGAMFGISVSPSPMPEKFIDEGDEINFGNSSLKVLFVPGHSPGHVVFYNEDQKLMIGGDVLFQGSIGRTDLPFGDHDTLIENIQNKLMGLDEQYEVHPGHGPTTTIGFEKKHNPFLQQEKSQSRE